MSAKYKKSSIQCPVCWSKYRKVMDSRAKAGGEGAFIRRRIECSKGHRYTTYERTSWAWAKVYDRREIIGKIRELISKL